MSKLKDVRRLDLLLGSQLDSAIDDLQRILWNAPTIAAGIKTSLKKQGHLNKKHLELSRLNKQIEDDKIYNALQESMLIEKKRQKSFTEHLNKKDLAVKQKYVDLFIQTYRKYGITYRMLLLSFDIHPESTRAILKGKIPLRARQYDKFDAVFRYYGVDINELTKLKSELIEYKLSLKKTSRRVSP